MDERCQSQTIWPAWSLPVSAIASINMLFFLHLEFFFRDPITVYAFTESIVMERQLK